MARIIEDESDWLKSQETELLNLPYDLTTSVIEEEEVVDDQEPSAYQKRADYIRSIPKKHSRVVSIYSLVL